ncbi:MAG: serine hydrolase [bacterium]
MTVSRTSKNQEELAIKHLAKKHIGFVLLAVFIGVQPLPAQQNNNYGGKIKVFEDFVIKQMQIDRIPGLSVGFMKDDFVWTRGFGYADLEHKIPATAKSAYRLASNTKSMTAVAILQLVEKGKVDLDAEVQTYVPYFPRKRWPVTVRQLLGHLGGISHYKNYDVEGHIKKHKDTRDALAIFADFELVAEPGTRYNYSSYGYNLLGAVIENAAKQSYGDYLRENLWEPLGMSDTHMDDPDEIIPNRVQGYRMIDGEIKNSEFVDVSSRFAAGGTISTVVDLLRYAKGLSAEQVLSRESIDLMYTSMTTKDGHFIDYGMGWRVSPVNGHFQVYHTGSQPETRTLLVRFPKENFAMALAYNFEGADRHVYAHRLAQLILDEPWNMRVYTGNKLDDAIYTGLWETFNYGFSYFDRYEQPRSTDHEDLAQAFAYFNAYVNRDSLLSYYKAMIKMIKDGRHPVAKEAFVKIGSYMAAKLREKFGLQPVETYHKMGAITFFNDYLEFCKLNPDHPGEFRFSEQFEKTVAQWYQDWKRTYTEYTRRLSVTPYSNLEEIGKKLKKTFSGAKIYPDFSQEFARATKYFYINGDREKALKVANIACELYPNSVVPYVYLANAYVCLGDKDKARRFYKKALEINSDNQAVKAESFNRYAEELADSGRLEEAMALLKLAVELFPREAKLYNSIAEIHLKIGKNFYQKALEVDPTFEPARERLKKIR